MGGDPKQKYINILTSKIVGTGLDQPDIKTKTGRSRLENNQKNLYNIGGEKCQ